MSEPPDKTLARLCEEAAAAFRGMMQWLAAFPRWDAETRELIQTQTDMLNRLIPRIDQQQARLHSLEERLEFGVPMRPFTPSLQVDPVLPFAPARGKQRDLQKGPLTTDGEPGGAKCPPIPPKMREVIREFYQQLLKEHPRWTRDQIATKVRDGLASRLGLSAITSVGLGLDQKPPPMDSAPDEEPPDSLPPPPVPVPVS